MSWSLACTISIALLLTFLLLLVPQKSPTNPPRALPSSVLPTIATSPSATTPPSKGKVNAVSNNISSLDHDDFNNEDDFNDPSENNASPPSTIDPPTAANPRIAGQAQNLHQVTRVIDGDTIEIASGQTIRLIGIDTPESVHPYQPVDCFGKEAAAFTHKLLQGQWINLESDITDHDRYGRLLRYVYLNGQFINQHLVVQGYATSYSYPPDIKYQSQLNAAETDARTHQRGLWSACQSSTSLTVSTAPSPDPSCRIKGNINSNQEKIYHLPECPYYNRTTINSERGERYFCTIEEAEAALWRRAQNCP